MRKKVAMSLLLSEEGTGFEKLKRELI